jgi:predicted GNAT superfamily acetyltransferase
LARALGQPSPTTIRSLETAEDYAACIELQEATWGVGFADRVPPSFLMATQHVGGVVAGAFEPDGQLVGFVLGLTGLRDGRPVHWSHMLAVRADRRDRGLGRALKRFQRNRLLERGVTTMYWTFDPLVARNANLNLNVLGAVVEEYVVDFYGPGEDSPVDRGIGTDRFIVRWDLGPDAPTRPGDWRGEPVRIEIPADIQEIKRRSLEQAQDWRRTTRQAFTYYLDLGYRVTGFEVAARGRGGCYRLEPPGAP